MGSCGWSLTRPNFFTLLKSSKQQETPNDNLMRSNNLIAINNDYCYIWKAESKTILKAHFSTIWKHNSGDIPPYNEYSLSASLTFEPDNLEVHRSKAFEEVILLWGSTGAAIVKLPSIQQQTLTSASKSEILTADCVIIAEKLYLEHLKLRILQVKWHPHIGNGCFLILNNDNFLRFYSLKEPFTPVTVVCVGPTSSKPFHCSSYSIGLVETPVDFEFGPELPTMGYYTLFVLKNSGELSYILVKYSEASKRCLWQEAREICVDNGEIEDSFEDATSLLCSKTFPLVLVIGCSTGKIHHTVLLPTSPEEVTNASSKGLVNAEESLLSGDVSLFIKEIVDLGSSNDDVGLTYVKLLPDPLFHNRYACIHGEGLHIIRMNFISSIARLFGDNSRKSLPLENNSEVEADIRYVIQCKLFGEPNEMGFHTYKSNFTFSDSIPQKFILVLGNQDTLAYEIPHLLDYRISHPEISETKTTAELPAIKEDTTDSASLNIAEAVKGILKKTTNQPFLILTKSEGDQQDDSSPEQAVLDSTRLLQREYLTKQEQAKTHLQESLDVFWNDAQEIKAHLATFISSDLNGISEKAQQLSDSIEVVSQNQENLQQRLDAVFGYYQQSLPVITEQERQWLNTFEKLENEIKSMESKLDEMKAKISNPLALSQNNQQMNELTSRLRIPEEKLNEWKTTLYSQQSNLQTMKKTVSEIAKRVR